MSKRIVWRVTAFLRTTAPTERANKLSTDQLRRLVKNAPINVFFIWFSPSMAITFYPTGFLGASLRARSWSQRAGRHSSRADLGLCRNTWQMGHVV